MNLFEKRLVVVTGKGGVGRSTIAAALGVAASMRGKRVLVIELSGTQALPPLFGLTGRSFAPRRGTDNLWISSLTVPECLQDFAQRKLHLSSLVSRIFHTQTASTFIDAIPGLHDLLQLGKIENLINEPAADDTQFDIVFIDAPATGHGLTLLSAARSMTGIAKAGPFHDLAAIIDAFLRDPNQTSVAVTTLPEALPVSETQELLEALAEDQLHVGALVANRCDPRPFPDHIDATSVLNNVRGIRHGAALADLGAQAMSRWSSQQIALSTLAHADLSVTQLPRLPRERLVQSLGERLAEAL